MERINLHYIKLSMKIITFIFLLQIHKNTNINTDLDKIG